MNKGIEQIQQETNKRFKELSGFDDMKNIGKIKSLKEFHNEMIEEIYLQKEEDKAEEKKILDVFTKRPSVLKDLEKIRDEVIKIQKDYKIRYSIIGVIDNIIKKYL